MGSLHVPELAARGPLVESSVQVVQFELVIEILIPRRNSQLYHSMLFSIGVHGSSIWGLACWVDVRHF